MFLFVSNALSMCELAFCDLNITINQWPCGSLDDRVPASLLQPVFIYTTVRMRLLWLPVDAIYWNVVI